MHLNHLFSLPQIKLYKTQLNLSKLTFFGYVSSKKGRCPDCNTLSRKVHCFYERRFRDLSILEYQVLIVLRSRKFKCLNKACVRKVFSQQNSGISRYGRRTNRLEDTLNTIALETNSHQGVLISKLLSVPLSRSTMTRKAHHVHLPAAPTPRVLGVDDWAFRKGINYGTVLVDMETSRVVDLLPSRDGSHLKKWLSKHSGIEIVTRDRASSYASAVREVYPEVDQVADRFHLLMNLSDALTLYLKVFPARSKTFLMTVNRSYWIINTMHPIHKKHRLSYLKYSSKDRPKTSCFSKSESLATTKVSCP